MGGAFLVIVPTPSLHSFWHCHSFYFGNVFMDLYIYEHLLLYNVQEAASLHIQFVIPFPFFLQYSSAKDGSALGVAVTRTALLTHCRSLTTACLYREGSLQPGVSCSAWNSLSLPPCLQVRRSSVQRTQSVPSGYGMD